MSHVLIVVVITEITCSLLYLSSSSNFLGFDPNLQLSVVPSLEEVNFIINNL